MNYAVRALHHKESYYYRMHIPTTRITLRILYIMIMNWTYNLL